MMTHELLVNGARVRAAADPDTSLLLVLRNTLGLQGPRFGCGLGQCGACTVHLDGVAVRSCVLPITAVAGLAITTLEGLAPPGGALHPMQQAFLDEQAVQCGYCLNGWIMTGAALARVHPRPATDADVRAGLSGLKCRCGTQFSILQAVKRGLAAMAAGEK